METAEEESEKPGTFAEEEPANEELRTDENAGPAVENSETLKLVLEDTVAEVLDDTVVMVDHFPYFLFSKKQIRTARMNEMIPGSSR